MSHRLYDWLGRIKAASREYQVMRIALDYLSNATHDEIHDLAEAREWDDFISNEINTADWNLDATYIIRIYSAFEMAVDSFWQQIPGNVDRKVEGDSKLDEVGYVQGIGIDVIEAVQAVRVHRNRVVHRRIEQHAGLLTIQNASHDLQLYLGRLPANWG